jgi:Ni/Co efflux regulator RcnB
MKKQLSRWMVCGALLILPAIAVAAQPLGQNDYGQDQDHHDNGWHGKDHGRDHRDHGRDHRDEERGDRGRDRGDRDAAWNDGDRHRDYRGPGRGHYESWHDRGRHEGWYRRGGYLPVEYRTRYVVTDWRRDHLREPPRGYHWVRSDDGDFLLVAVTTGVIMDILLHH